MSSAREWENCTRECGACAKITLQKRVRESGWRNGLKRVREMVWIFGRRKSPCLQGELQAFWCTDRLCLSARTLYPLRSPLFEVSSVRRLSQYLRYWFMYLNQPIWIQGIWIHQSEYRDMVYTFERCVWKFLIGSLDSITSWERFLEVGKVPYREYFLRSSLPWKLPEETLQGKLPDIIYILRRYCSIGPPLFV